MFLQRPVLVEAVRWTGHNEPTLRQFCGVQLSTEEEDLTLHNAHYGRWDPLPVGHWVVKINGVFWSMPDDEFREKYQELESDC